MRKIYLIPVVSIVTTCQDVILNSPIKDETDFNPEWIDLDIE